MPTFTLHITGHANLPMLAEQANLRISASSTGSNKQSVSDEVLTTAKYIEDMIHQVQTQDTNTKYLAVAHWSQTTLSTNSWIEYIPRFASEGREVIGGLVSHDGSRGSLFGANNANSNESMVPVRSYRARIEFDVRFRDFALLSECCSSHLTSLEHCEIESLTWVLLPTTQEQYKSQLRRKATDDARAKVKDYCQAVCAGDDVTIVPTELVGENAGGGLFTSAGRLRDKTYNTGFGQPQGSLFGSAQGHVNSVNATTPSSDLSLTPQEINMTLSVDWIFTVETGGFKLSAI